MERNGYFSVSVHKILIDRVDKIFLKAGFTNRASYIQQRLRESIEKDEKRYDINEKN